MSTPAAVLSAFDANQWSGTTVMTWDGLNVVLPTYAAGEGLFFDLMHFLNSRGSGTDGMVPVLAAAWIASGAAGAMTMGIDSTTGRVYVESSLVDFTIGASTSNAFWGFDSAGHAAVGGVAPFRRVAPSAWQTGPTTTGGLTIDPAGAPAAFTVGAARYWQDPITALRQRGSADADDDNATNNLEALINTVSGEASVRVGMTATGRVYMAWLVSIGHPGPPTWVSASFRAQLGFSGLETTQSSGSVRYVVGDYLPHGVIVFPDGVREDDLTASTTGSAHLLMSGAYGAASYGTRKGRRFAFDIRGPVVDTTQHLQWIERVVQYLTPGAEVSVYPVWGRPQRRLSPLDVTVSQPAHDLLYTTAPSYAPGYHGRYRGRVATAMSQEHATQWAGESRTWYRVTVDATAAD